VFFLSHSPLAQVIGEMWRPAGGAYNVDGVLRIMVRGLEEELDARMSGTKIYAATQKRPSTPVDAKNESDDKLPMLQQGTDVGYMLKMTKRLGSWVFNRARGILSRK
jgi:hypothetical protein